MPYFFGHRAIGLADNYQTAIGLAGLDYFKFYL